ncbi:MAG: thioredoxin domain-containing protein [Dethiobacteria bacterium]|nr:thioredoxin domain-containing protein [Bacillota bacterium]
MDVNNENKTGKPNRLIDEKSPYLLQHAYNPVQWYPWGEEAFRKAEEENKPVFLSIGYSTCHWCHVMEKDSFEDEEVARILNENFVSVKVDREERPDLDQKYMSACQALTGQGGWPLTVFLTPAKKAFYAGTFFPKHSRYGITGMLDLLPGLVKFWQNDHERVLQAGEELEDALRRMIPGSKSKKNNILSDLQGKGLPEKAYRQLQAGYDKENGGFGEAPKFPAAHQLIFLIKYFERTGEQEALDMAMKTLRAIYRGGIFDQVGYGLHRYSVDKFWLVPHFEKMLYDQAVTALAALEAFSVSGAPEMAELAEKIFIYVLRDLTSPEGPFYTAEDADSEGEEGTFYVWSYEELFNLLSEEESSLAADYYGVTKEGNFEHGKSILHRLNEDQDFARLKGFDKNQLSEFLEKIRTILLQKRSARIRPFRDDKIITAWNGLMIASLARGSVVLNNSAYLEAAEKAAAFILDNMVTGNGRLLRRYREGESAIPAFLDDYSALVWANLELYLASGKSGYLETAKHLNTQLTELFLRENGLLLYSAESAGEDSAALPAEAYDGASPSGLSITVMNFLRLGQMLQDESLADKGREIIAAQADAVGRHPTGFTYLLSALIYALKSNEALPHCIDGGSCGLE